MLYLKILILIHNLYIIGSSYDINSWDSSITKNDTYFYHYRPYAVIRPTKKVKTTARLIDKRKWKLHKSTRNINSHSESNNNIISTEKETTSTPNQPGIRFEYPNVVPYNKILVPTSLYKNNIHETGDSVANSLRGFESTSKKHRRRKHQRILKRNKKKSAKKRRVHKNTQKQNKAKTYEQNPVSKFFRGMYYKYFTEKDRQFEVFDLSPVNYSNAYHLIPNYSNNSLLINISEQNSKFFFLNHRLYLERVALWQLVWGLWDILKLLHDYHLINDN